MIVDPQVIHVQNVAEPAKWLGETFGFWVQTLMFAVSALAGILVIRSRGHQEGRRATVDLIIDQKRDEKLIAARKVIMEMHEKAENNIARYLDRTDSEEYKAIMLCLNNYEFIACGIKVGAFSEKIYKRLRCSMVIRDWEAWQGFVIEFRKQKKGETFFQDFEWLYREWKKNPLKHD